MLNKFFEKYRFCYQKRKRTKTVLFQKRIERKLPGGMISISHPLNSQKYFAHKEENLLKTK